MWNIFAVLQNNSSIIEDKHLSLGCIFGQKSSFKKILIKKSSLKMYSGPKNYYKQFKLLQMRTLFYLIFEQNGPLEKLSAMT
jgi:hypothetical protein